MPSGSLPCAIAPALLAPRVVDRAPSCSQLTWMSMGNSCNEQLFKQLQKPHPTVAFGNATGGLLRGGTNLTSGLGSPGGPTWFDYPLDFNSIPFSRGSSIPELKWITQELRRRGKLEQFAGIFVRDDTLTQSGVDIAATEWLKANEPSFVPLVNQVGGATGPQTLYRTGLFISGPEQYSYAHSCMDGNCSDTSQESWNDKAMQQLNRHATNMLVDFRFGLQSWPLFLVGAGNGPLNSSNPDKGRGNIRSDSLVRWAAYSAVAFGAKGLYYYCWGGGIYWYNSDSSKPGRPTSTYQTVVEANADAAAWGDEMLAGGYEFASAMYSMDAKTQRFTLQAGGLVSEDTVVTAMSDQLIATVFVPSEDDLEPHLPPVMPAARAEVDADVDADVHAEVDPAASPPFAYLFVLDRRVSGQVARLPARNVTLTLHPSVGVAVVVPPGRQGRRGFDELRARHGVPPPPLGRRRPHYSHVAWHHPAEGTAGEGGAGEGLGKRALQVTVEVVGGGGAFVRLYPVAGGEAALLRASFSSVDWIYKKAEISMLTQGISMNTGLKAPSEAYDSWHPRYRPYDGLEKSAGHPFEDATGGEQTNFIIGASFLGSLPPTAADEAEAWAWAGYNLLSLEAPSDAALREYGPSAAAVGTVLDAGYSFGFFVTLEPRASASFLEPLDVVKLNRAYRCHGRWAGLVLARRVNDTAATSAAVVAAAALKTYAHGSWLLPLTTTSSAKLALELGERGVPLAMPSVPHSTPGGESAIAWAQAVVAQYEPMRAMLAASYVATITEKNVTRWSSEAELPFVAALDACASDSDSMLRWSAFSALAYGARGLYWQGAGKCAPHGSAKFGLIASINKRIAAWGNTFVANLANPGRHPGGGYNVTRMWSSGFTLPHAVRPGSGGPTDLVQAADADVLIVKLQTPDGREERNEATPLLYVVDQRVSHTPGAAQPRTVRVTLREDVKATQPVEGDCAASRCLCAMSLIGNVLTIKLPGGSGQLVALAIAPSSLPL